MKLHLPIALLTAMLLSNAAAYAYGIYTVAEQDKIYVGANETIYTKTDTDTHNLLNKAGYTGTTNPNAIVKTGDGELVIDKDVTMYNPFVVDQGKVLINDATVTSHRTAVNGNSCLSIGGATMELDNGHFTQTGSSVYAICVGNRDGAATLELKNGSSMYTNHYVFAGYTGIDRTDYRVGIDSTPATNTATSYINISSGSKLTAGTSLQFANVVVNVDGTGSVLADNGTNSTGNQWPDSYIAYGDNFNSTIKATNGGTLDFNWNLYTATDKNSQATIDVTGTGSSINVAGVAYLSMQLVYENYSYSNDGAITTLNITEGAKGNISQMVMGADAGEAKLNVGSGSEYKGVSLRVGQNGTVNTEGKITLTAGETTDWYTDGLSGGVHGSTTQTTQGLLSIEGGEVNQTKGNTTVDNLNMSDQGQFNTTGLLVKKDTTIENATLKLTSGRTDLLGNITLKNEAVIEQNAGTAVLNSSSTVDGQKVYSVLDAQKGSSITVNGGTLNVKGIANIDGAVNCSSGNFTSTSAQLITATENSSFKATGGTINVGKLVANGSEFIAYPKGKIIFEKDVTTENTTFSIDGGSTMIFSGDVALNGGNVFEVTNVSSTGFQFGFKDPTKHLPIAVTANGKNDIKGSVTMITGSSLVAQSGTLNITSAPEEAASNGQKISLTSVRVADNAAEGTKINVTANGGFLSISGNSKISSLTINGAETGNSQVGARWESKLTGDVMITDKLSINNAGKQNEFVGELGLLDTTTIDVESGSTLTLNDVAVTATSLNADYGVLDNLLSAENVTLSDGFSIAVSLSQNVINQLNNGTDTVNFNLVLLSENVDSTLSAADLESIVTLRGFESSSLEIVQNAEGGYTLQATATIPEPTTATLSLLALAALAARRRRK